MKNILITLFGVAFLLSSCCMSCRDNNAPTYLMDQNYKDYVVFPVGSYWIYLTDSGQKDSVYLYRQEIRINDSQKIHSYNYEQFNQNLGSTFFKDTLFGGGEAEKYNGIVFFFYAERYISNSVITNLQFFDKIEAGTVLDFADDSKVKYIEELSSYFVEGKEYTNIKVFENLIPTDERLPQKVYYAKNVGIVKKELFNGQVWNLKRYFINN